MPCCVFCSALWIRWFFSSLLNIQTFLHDFQLHLSACIYLIVFPKKQVHWISDSFWCSTKERLCGMIVGENHKCIQTYLKSEFYRGRYVKSLASYVLLPQMLSLTDTQLDYTHCKPVINTETSLPHSLEDCSSGGLDSWRVGGMGCWTGGEMGY